MMQHFIIIGAPRSGTTSLYHYLSQHPQVSMGPLKETNFFAYLAWREQKVHDVNPPHGEWPVKTFEDYQRLFQNAKPGPIRAIGEASPFYLYVPGVPKQIKACLPQAKLILVLRNPIERAYSAYLKNVRDGFESRSFEEAIAMERVDSGRVVQSSNHYIRAGLYFQHINRYLEYFEASQIKIDFYENLVSTPHILLSSIFDFIGVDPRFIADTSVRFNRSVPALIRKTSHREQIKSITRRVRSLIPQKLYYLLLNLEFGISSRMASYPSLSDQSRLLLRDLFMDDVKNLEKFLQQDLSTWLGGA